MCIDKEVPGSNSSYHLKTFGHRPRAKEKCDILTHTHAHSTNETLDNWNWHRERLTIDLTILMKKSPRKCSCLQRANKNLAKPCADLHDVLPCIANLKSAYDFYWTMWAFYNRQLLWYPVVLKVRGQLLGQVGPCYVQRLWSLAITKRLSTFLLVFSLLFQAWKYKE